MSPKQKSHKKQAETIITNFSKRGIEGYYCEDRASAVEKAMGLIAAGSTVSWGGSTTLAEIGIMDVLKDSDLELIDRMTAVAPREKKEIYAKTVMADYYLTSANAITLDGQLINIDGNGNRVACIITGPDNVIVIAGMNKIATDVDAGIARVRNFAAPPNAQRLGSKTPCAVTGKCEDCLSPDCLCCNTVITRKSKIPNRIKVILVGEELGF